MRQGPGLLDLPRLAQPSTSFTVQSSNDNSYCREGYACSFMHRSGLDGLSIHSKTGETGTNRLNWSRLNKAWLQPTANTPLLEPLATLSFAIHPGDMQAKLMNGTFVCVSCMAEHILRTNIEVPNSREPTGCRETNSEYKAG